MIAEASVVSAASERSTEPIATLRAITFEPARSPTGNVRTALWRSAAQAGRARRDDWPVEPRALARHGFLQVFSVFNRRQRMRRGDERFLWLGAGAGKPSGGVASDLVNEGHRPLPAMNDHQRRAEAQVQPRDPASQIRHRKRRAEAKRLPLPTPADVCATEIDRRLRDTPIRSRCERKAPAHPCASAITIT
ncbi:MAG: hypothetical protein INR70_10940 [Parafilimonas terrae]|nr:hypothetical protein [Parafilimonas terrae]